MLQLPGFEFGKKSTDCILFLHIVRVHMLTCYNSGAILHDYHSIELTLIFLNGQFILGPQFVCSFVTRCQMIARAEKILHKHPNVMVDLTSGTGRKWELLDRKNGNEVYVSDGNGSEVTEMGGICYEKFFPTHLY